MSSVYIKRSTELLPATAYIGSDSFVLFCSNIHSYYSLLLSIYDVVIYSIHTIVTIVGPNSFGGICCGETVLNI